MLRRDIFRAGLAGAAGLFGLRQASAATGEDRLKVAYHLSDADRVNFVLLVVHGPALAAFKAKSASGATSSRFAGLVQQGLVPQACGNTMRGMGIALTDLLAGFRVADKGGVVKLAELQRQGYVYLRP